jgi:uncharacterized membrane protein YcaP (DUF421 family)
MNPLYTIFGNGKDLNCLQMSCRGIVVFFIAFALIRISGRRSFGLRTPLDNIIAVLLGAILSRAVVGASAFLPVIITCFVIVVLHRLFSWLIIKYRKFGNWFNAKHILLYENGHFIRKNLQKALAREEDAMQGVRKSGLTDDLSLIDKIYMESNGEISVVRKDVKKKSQLK